MSFSALMDTSVTFIFWLEDKAVRHINGIVSGFGLDKSSFFRAYYRVVDTTFYYFASEKQKYLQYQLNSSLALTTSFIDLSVLKEEINHLYLEETNEIK
ncbi:hypothetical protein [Rodentibacter pneumotropicus]|nr:hypothetical protein [Rodentibacter pneumotropicus]